MRFRSTLTALFAACGVAAPASAQSTVRTSAGYPSREALDRLNLAVEWAVFLPIDGQKDSVAHAQIVDGNQLLVETRSGVILAIDMKTGQRMWSFAFPHRYATPYPACVNSKFVFVVNLSTLYAIDRYTGVLEFAFEPVIRLMAPRSLITAGPVCDETYVYVTLGSRQVVSYKIPGAVEMPDATLRPDAKAVRAAGGGQPGVKNPADVVAARYPGVTIKPLSEDKFDERGKVRLDVTGSLSLQRTPSLSMLPTITPPYSIKDSRGIYERLTPSLSTLTNMRQPYHIRDGEGRNLTKTPSIATIPPSAARVYELNEIRPKGIEPEKRWYYTPPVGANYRPILTPDRMWITTTGPALFAIDRVDTTRTERNVLVDATLTDVVAAPAGQDGSTGFFPLADGSLIAVDLDFGGRDARTAMRTLWRANVGGAMNRIPVPTAESVYVAGVGSGVARVDRARGEVVWRTAALDDRLLALNDEYVYVRDRNGVVRIYDRNRVADAQTGKSNPLAAIDMSDFGVPITNSINDRILLASDNGLLVCLRDTAAKYNRPVPLIPSKPAAVAKPAEPKPGDPADPTKPMEAKPADPVDPAKPADKKNDPR